MARDVYVLAPPHDTALISYALLKASVIAFVLRDREIHVHTLPLPPAKMRELVPRFLSLCSDPTSDVNLINNDGRQLYRTLVEPLEPDLRGVTALRIETDGIPDPFRSTSCARPVATILETGSKSVFARIWLRTQYPSTSLTPVYRPEHRFSRCRLGARFLSGPATRSRRGGYRGSRTLPQTYSDLRARGYASGGAHPTAGRATIPLRWTRVCRLQPGRASLGPDSLLSAHDIATLRLRNLKLAVLSACDTANGDEGTSADLNSVARTLVAAGVPDVVASRWRVDSTITRQLMHVFYSNLISGKSPAEALRAAGGPQYSELPSPLLLGVVRGVWNVLIVSNPADPPCMQPEDIS